MLRIFAYNHYATVSLDYFALVAHWLYRCTYFHFLYLPKYRILPKGLSPENYFSLQVILPLVRS